MLSPTSPPPARAAAQAATAGQRPSPHLHDSHHHQRTSPHVPAPLPTPPPTQRGASPSPSMSGLRPKPAPLLSLSPAAIPSCAAVESPSDEEDISTIWTVISRAADVVKDGERLENLAWRHWSQPHPRRRSSSSTDTGSTGSGSLHTPVDRPGLHRTCSCDHRSFTGKLKLLVEENTFKDWIEDARQHAAAATSSDAAATAQQAAHTSASSSSSSTPLTAPHLALPDTPMPDLEIRLVEPTPVPSRVGSLGNGSLTGSNMLARSMTAASRPQPPVREEAEEEGSASRTAAAAEASDATPSAHPQRRRGGGGGGNRFFFASDKISGGSESSQASVGTASTGAAEVAAAPQPAPASPAPVAAPAAPAAPPAEEPVAAVSPTGSNFRSSASGESSNAVVLKKKERRPVSMATMSGRYQREKRIAAQAIAAKTAAAAPEQGSSDDDDDEDWEDDDEEDEVDDEEGGDCEPGDDAANAADATGDNGDSGEGDDDDWEDESPEQSVKPAPPLPGKSKKERAAEKARAEAEKARLEQERKSKMFAKLQIEPAKPAQSEGLLTRTFRSGKSLVDLTQAGQDDHHPAGGSDIVLRRAPTHAQFTTLSHSPVQANAPSGLLRSKSAVAMPVQSGVSVMSRRSGESQRSGTSDDRRPAPDEVEMESSDDDSEDDNYLASSQVQRKLDVLAAKRDARRACTAKSPQPGPVPVPVPAQGDFDENGVVRPMSPTARRRLIIMREMSESLRRNIILEREKSSGASKPFGHARPPPSVHTSRLPTVASGLNLAGMNNAAAANGQAHPGMQHRHSDDAPKLGRHSSHPNLTGYAEDDSPTLPPRGADNREREHRSSISPNEAMRRRSHVLGSGLLRPLTRADEPGLAPLNRTRSAAALNTVEGGEKERTSPSPRAPSMLRSSSGIGLQAPPMVRSSTEGDQEERERQRKRELMRRSEATDTSYRWHGW